MKKIAILLAVFIVASFAEVDSLKMGTCSSDLVDYAFHKRNLAKRFKECNDKYSNYSISVLMFKVKEGESGREERSQCLEEYQDSVDVFTGCFNKVFPEQAPYSIEEGLGYFYAWRNFNAVLSYIVNYAEVQEKMNGMPVLDAYNFLDEETVFQNFSLEYMEQQIAETEGSREDKDVLLLYFKYLKAKYDWQYRCSIKPAFVCDTSWLGESKAEFLKKYPETQYRDFVETQMPGYVELSAEEKKLAAEDDEKIAQKNREHAIEEAKTANDVWLALSGMAMFGFPVSYTSGFDDNFDVSNALTLGLKASWRSVVLQYQYFLSFGDNNKGGSVSEKGYTIMGGVMLGPKKIFTLDVLFGLSYIDTYPLAEDMPEANLDDESWTLAFQGTYYFPISGSWDITAHIQARMNFVENYCRDTYWDPDGFSAGDGRCDDPFRNGDNEKYWDDLQWTFSAGVGIRFWKPRY